MYSVSDETRKPIFEGVQGENEAREIQFDVTAWVEELGDGVCTATAKRPTDTTPYPVTVTRSGNVVTWKPNSTDTSIEGIGAFQLAFSINDVVAKTRIWNTKIAPSLVGAGDPPDPYDDWIQDLRDIAAETLTYSQNAENSADDAEAEKLESEAWAKGTKNGTPVPSTADQYENNAKYWAGQAEDLKDATQAIVDEARADVFEAMDGLHEETTAGSALQLISDKYTENKEPYLFRKSIAGDRELDTLVGGSVAFNQLCNGSSVTVTNWHKYVMKKSSVWSIGTSTGSAITGLTAMQDMVFDLTQMFGSSVADYIYALEQATTGAGVAFFRSWFPKDYYAYNTGELMSVKASAHEMVGFNQWDEEWELGGLSSETGLPYSSTNSIRSKNYIPVLPNTTYYYKSSENVMKVFYDAEMNFIGIEYGYNTTFVTPQNCHYMKIGFVGAYGTTYRGDTCINISSDRNGEYQPYTKHTYALDDVELRGVAKLDSTPYFDGDTYEADGTVTRKYGIVDLGTLNWALGSGIIFTALLPGLKYQPDNALPLNAIGGIYTQVSKQYFQGEGANVNLIMRSDNSEARIYVNNNAYTDAAALKTAMSGVYLVYELATPTTETADPFTSPQIVDAYGTERYVDERTVAVPVGHVTKYPDNLREKLDGLPWDFSTLIAPTEKAYTATRNYTTGSLFIVGNVLYKATANIANGGTITPNTNCTATTLAEVISAL